MALFAAGWWNNGKVQNDGVAPVFLDVSCSSPGSNLRIDSASRAKLTYLGIGDYCTNVSAQVGPRCHKPQLTTWRNRLALLVSTDLNGY